MTRTSTVNLIYLGNFSDVDPDEHNFRSEDADDLTTIGKIGYEDLSLVEATLSDAWRDGLIKDNDDGTHDSMSYNRDGNEFNQATDSTLTGMLEITLTDGTTKKVEAVLIQTENGDLFANDLLNCGTLDDLDISSIEITEITGSDYSGWYSWQSVEHTTFGP
ncbi:MAG: hypothetical protein LC676_07570, partial [Loktanella sp.]|nr:hypothetical protein [Loktanella sp.]